MQFDGDLIPVFQFQAEKSEWTAAVQFSRAASDLLVGSRAFASGYDRSGVGRKLDEPAEQGRTCPTTGDSPGTIDPRRRAKMPV